MVQLKQDMALLKAKLQMPMIIRDFLITDQKPDAAANYSLHDMLGSMHPCAALLSACLTVQEISSFENIQSADLTFLTMECERITERYAMRLIMAEENPSLWAETQTPIMESLAEDLSSFLELLEMCYMSYEITSPKAAPFIGILITQLQSQAMIIDEVVHRLEEQGYRQTNTIHAPISGSQANNVIAFPTAH